MDQNSVIAYSLLVFTSFFTLINPISILPVYLGLTAEIGNKEKLQIASRAVFAALLILLGFAFSGQFLFKFFGISVDSFRIVGGAIFFIVGFDMLNARLSPIKGGKDEIHKAAKDIAITPLAIPMLCGPGAITNAIVLMEDAVTISHKIAFAVSVLVVLLLSYLIFAFSTRIVKYLGETGINVMLRIMGLIIMVIAVEFFKAGITPFINSFLN
ncbi:MAG: NAAT family transporter [Bacteroidales bacterium]|nr:NAAT family transporter [Bacteroidales bacterium]